MHTRLFMKKNHQLYLTALIFLGAMHACTDEAI